MLCFIRLVPYKAPHGRTELPSHPVMEHLDQFITLKMHQLGWPLEAMFDLLLAALAGGMVGIERELRGRQAGFRTNILVAVGSAMVMIVSNRMADRGWPSPGKTGVQVSVDPGRIAYGV